MLFIQYLKPEKNLSGFFVPQYSSVLANSFAALS
jgi:hypothetical protein